MEGACSRATPKKAIRSAKVPLVAFEILHEHAGCHQTQAMTVGRKLSQKRRHASVLEPSPTLTRWMLQRLQPVEHQQRALTLDEPRETLGFPPGRNLRRIRISEPAQRR